jgi:hypothetical protein
MVSRLERKDLQDNFMLVALLDHLHRFGSFLAIVVICNIDPINVAFKLQLVGPSSNLVIPVSFSLRLDVLFRHFKILQVFSSVWHTKLATRHQSRCETESTSLMLCRI